MTTDEIHPIAWNKTWLWLALTIHVECAWSFYAFKCRLGVKDTSHKYSSPLINSLSPWLQFWTKSHNASSGKWVLWVCSFRRPLLSMFSGCAFPYLPITLLDWRRCSVRGTLQDTLRPGYRHLHHRLFKLRLIIFPGKKEMNAAIPPTKRN